MRIGKFFCGALLACVSAAVLAFDPATDHTCVANCGGPSSGPAPSGPVYTGPSPQQIQAEKRRAMEEQQRLELERRRADEQRFDDLRDAAAGELRGTSSSASGLKGTGDASDVSELKRRGPGSSGSNSNAKNKQGQAQAQAPKPLQSCKACQAGRDNCTAGCDNLDTSRDKLKCVNRCNTEYACVIGADCK